MELEVRKQIDEIWAILRETAELGRATERRMDRAERRMEKFDQQLEATRRLVQAGIKMVTRLAADTRELKRSQKAFLDSFRNGRNGHKDKH